MDVSLAEAFHREKVLNNQTQNKSSSRIWKSSTQAQEAVDDIAMDIRLQKAFHSSSREADTGAFGRSPVELPVPDNQKLRYSNKQIWNSGHRISADRELHRTDQSQVSSHWQAPVESMHSSETLIFIQRLIEENLQLKKALEESQYQQQSLGAAEATIEKLSKRNASLQLQLQVFRNKSTRSPRKVCWHHLYSKCRFGPKCWYEHPKVQQPAHRSHSRKSYSKTRNMQTNTQEKHEEARYFATTVREPELKKAKSLPSTKNVTEVKEAGILDKEVTVVKDVTEEVKIDNTERKKAKVSGNETDKADPDAMEMKASDNERINSESVTVETIKAPQSEQLNETLQSISRKRKNRRKKRSANKVSEYDDENTQNAGIIEAIKTTEKHKNDSQARGADNAEVNEVFERLEGNDKDNTGVDFEDCGNLDSEVDSEEEMELRKICARDFSIDEKYEDYDPKDLKYIYGHELSLIKEKRKAQEKEEENKDSR